MSSNLPPGVTENMIPGNRPIDAAYEQWCDQYGGIHGGAEMDKTVADAILLRAGVTMENSAGIAETREASSATVLALRTALITALRALDGEELALLAVDVDAAPRFDDWWYSIGSE